MVSFSFSLHSGDSLYDNSLSRWYRMAAVFCSKGWHESLGIIRSVVVGFL